MRIETDMFFTRKGEYVWNPQLNRRGVYWFNKTVRDMAKTGMDFVVTGVFAAHTERLMTTIATGIANGYDVYIKTLSGSYGDVHNVPKEHYESMKRCFVSDKALRGAYNPDVKEHGQVHFGLMPVTKRRSR